MRVVPANREIALSALRIIKDCNMDPRDAIHAATAIAEGADCIVSTDADFHRVKGIKKTEPVKRLRWYPGAGAWRLLFTPLKMVSVVCVQSARDVPAFEAVIASVWGRFSMEDLLRRLWIRKRLLGHVFCFLFFVPNSSLSHKFWIK